MEKNEDYLCKSGKQHSEKCATTKTINATCTSIDHSQPTCQISYNIGGGDQSGTEFCMFYEDYYNSYCPLQSDSKEMKDYIELYKKEREKMDQNDIDKIHVGNMEDKDRFTLNSNKKVLEAYVNLQYYKIIGDNECIRDFFISDQKANKNKLSILIMLLLSLLMI